MSAAFSDVHISAAVLVYMFTARRRRKQKDVVVPGATATISDVRAVSGGASEPPPSGSDSRGRLL